MADQPRNPGNAVFGFNSGPSNAPTPTPDPGPGPAPAPTPTATAAPTPTPPAYTPPAYAPPAYAPQQYPVQPYPAPRSRTPVVLTILVILLVVAAGINFYLVWNLQKSVQQAAVQTSDQLSVLSHRMDANDERYAQLRGQFQVTTERLGMTQQELGRARQLAANIEQQQKQAVSQLNQAIAQKASADQLNALQTDANNKFGGINTDIAGLNKKIGDTNDALTGAKGELSGAIAKTHDELVALAHKTDRDYFEFTLTRGRQQKVGNMSVRLEKTNVKKNNFTADLFFDDRRIVRKDQAVDSPVLFYMQGAPNACELVVNKLDKNTISGYLSTPKGFFPNTPNVLQTRPGGGTS